MMPRLNGFDVAASLKNDPEYMGIPILMLTVVDDAQRAYGLGVERYLSKPFEPQEIVSEIEELIRRRTEPGAVLALGELGPRQTPLKSAVEAIGHTFEVASDVDMLVTLAEKTPPSLIVLTGEEYQDGSAVARMPRSAAATLDSVRQCAGGTCPGGGAVPAPDPHFVRKPFPCMWPAP